MTAFGLLDLNILCIVYNIPCVCSGCIQTESGAVAKTQVVHLGCGDRKMLPANHDQTGQTPQSPWIWGYLTKKFHLVYVRRFEGETEHWLRNIESEWEWGNAGIRKAVWLNVTVKLDLGSTYFLHLSCFYRKRERTQNKWLFWGEYKRIIQLIHSVSNHSQTWVWCLRPHVQTVPVWSFIKFFLNNNSVFFLSSFLSSLYTLSTALWPVCW